MKVAVADEELKDIPGGVAEIQTDAFSATFRPVGIACKVKVIHGSSCPSCGGTIGKIPMMSVASGVKCEKCNKLILETYTSDDIEII